MQAIILAAGMGRRLGEWTRDDAKCMLPVNGIRLIDRLLSQLSNHQLTRVIIVVGYHGEKVKDHIGSRYSGRLNIEYYNNPLYETTNNIYSLSIVKEQMTEDDTLLIESDLIVDDRMFDIIIEDNNPNIALVAKYQTWMDGTMVCLDEDNNIVNFVPKQAFRYEDTSVYYKTVNIYKFSREFSRRQYVPFLEAYLSAAGRNEYYEQVLRVITLINRSGIKAKDIGDLPWYEIDDVQDKDIAENLFSTPSERLPKLYGRYGGFWRFERMLDYCYLVNPYFPPRRLIDEMQANFDVLLSQYPSGSRICRLLAGKCFNVNQKYITVANGAAELIKSLMAVLPGRKGIIFPTFEEYANRLSADNIVQYYAKYPDYSYNAADLKKRYERTGISALVLVNPDNPSGQMMPVSEVLELSEWCNIRNITLIVDESFTDFGSKGSGQTLIREYILDAHPALVVVKSISKSYGVPGLRLGVVASGNEAIIETIQRDLPIWNINSFAEFFMQIFNKYEADYRKAQEDFRRERSRFQEDLQRIPILRVLPSEANYFLCEVLPPLTSRQLTEILIARYYILIKDCKPKVGFDGHDFVRIAIRNGEDNKKLVEALITISKEINSEDQ